MRKKEHRQSFILLLKVCNVEHKNSLNEDIILGIVFTNRTKSEKYFSHPRLGFSK
jgi:hypothetical protein